MLSTDAGQVSNTVYQNVFALRKLLGAYEAKLTNKSCEHFLAAITLIINAVEEFHSDSAAHIKSQFPDNKEKADEHLRTNSLIAVRILSNIHQNQLPLLAAAADHSAYPLLPILKRAIKLVGAQSTGIELGLVPRFEYTYGFTGFFEFAKKEIAKLPYPDQKKKELRLAQAEQLPTYTAFISFPIVDQSSYLRLSVLTHELAHLVDYIQHLYRAVMPHKLDQASFDALVKSTERSVIPLGMPEKDQLALELPSHDEIEALCHEKCVSLVRAWLREIIADVLAIRALGPAYLFSFVEFLSHAGLTNEPDTEHPAPAKRIEIMIGEMEEMKYFTSGHGVRDELDAFKERALREAAGTQYAGETLVADQTIKKNLENILLPLRKLVGDSAFTASKYALEVPAAVAKLSNGIAPIEKGSGDLAPFSAVVILNAGWETYRQRFVDFRTLFVSALKDTEVVLNLNHLIFKALEGSELVRSWKELK